MFRSFYFSCAVIDDVAFWKRRDRGECDKLLKQLRKKNQTKQLELSCQ